MANDLYTTWRARQSKAEIVNLRPWDADAVIRDLEDPWIYREAADALAEVAQNHPDLGVYGWDLLPPLIDEPASVECFAIARAWLRRLARSKTLAVNSYYLKHVLEHESQSSSIYCANGILIGGAISVGIAQRRGERKSPNSLLGLRLPPNNWQWKIWPGSRIRALLPEEPLSGDKLPKPKP